MDPTPEPAKMKAGCSPAFLYKEFRNEYSSFGGARAQFSDCCGDAFQTTPPQGSGGRLNTVRASSTLAPTGAVLLEIARGHDGRNNAGSASRFAGLPSVATSPVERLNGPWSNSRTEDLSIA